MSKKMEVRLQIVYVCLEKKNCLSFKIISNQNVMMCKKP